MIRKFHKSNKPARGIALVSVLTMSVILLAMAGAFFLAHKSDLALMGTSVKIEKTKNAALSAAEFLHYKLENDRRFGVSAFEQDGRTEVFPPDADSPKLEVEYRGSNDVATENVIYGRVLGTGLEFEAQLMNNLDSDSVGYHPKGEAPPRTARVWIRAEKGQVVKHMDFILKRSPFTSVSMLSGGNIGVQLTSSQDGHWWLGARQPSGNGVRANGTITGPEVLNSKSRAVLFEPPEGLGSKVKPPYGVMQGKELKMQMNGVTTNISAKTPELEAAEANIRGVLSADSTEMEVPKLDASKLASYAQSFKMPASRLTFSSQQDPLTGLTTHSLYENGKLAATYDGTATSDRKYEWVGPGGLSMATFDLESRVMRISESVELKSKNRFILEAEGDSGGQPTLVLGSQTEGASIEAEGITVKGSVGGMGALKAGDGDLRIRAKSSLSTTPDYGVALHSSRDVVLSKPGASNQDGIPTDWDAFSEGFEETVGSNFNGWAEKPEEKQAELASSFSKITLSKPGEVDATTDPLWLSLTKELPADAKAKSVYDNWLRPEVPEITEEVEIPPDLPPPATGTTGGTTGPPPVPEYETVVVQEGVPAGPGMDVERYIRLREYLRTVKSGEPDDSWLNSTEPDIQLQRRNDVKDLIKNQLSSYQLAAGQTANEEGGHVTLSWNPLTEYFKGSNPFLSGYFADMKFRGLIYAGGSFKFDTQKLGIELEGAVVAHDDIKISNATGARFIYNSELLEDVFATNEGDTSAKLERSFWAYY